MSIFHTSKERRVFDPFNLNFEAEKAQKRIKFERLPLRIKTKPTWWLLFLFLIVMAIYYYLSKSIP